MTDRDRLVELLINSPSLDTWENDFEGAADYLLANGVFILPEDLRGTEDFSISAFIEAMQMYKEKDRYIKPPCKVGDTIYKTSLLDEVVELKAMRFVNVIITEPYNSCVYDDFGKIIFLTKEEAEEKLKELEENV